MLKIGLTGGIGSGKTTVANLFIALNVPVIDSDVIAQQLTAPHAPAFNAIKQHFGSEILNEQGNINRTQLRHIIFSNREAKKWLENLLHPLIRELIRVDLLATQSPYGVVAIPLLVETSSYDLADRILVVDTSPEKQISRTMERDQLSRDDVALIMATQAKREERLAVADDIILNDGNIDSLKQQVTLLHQRYLQLAATL